MVERRFLGDRQSAFDHLNALSLRHTVTTGKDKLAALDNVLPGMRENIASGIVDEELVSAYYGATAELFRTTDTMQQQVELMGRVDPKFLISLVDSETMLGWTPENVQKIWDAYATFVTLEDRYGPERGREVIRGIAYDMLEARAMDHALNLGSVTAAGKTVEVISEDGKVDVPVGSVLQLSSSGNEVTMIGGKVGSILAVEDLGKEVVLDTYYRGDGFVTEGRATPNDGRDRLQTWRQHAAQIYRTVSSPRPQELALAGHVDKEGKISVVFSGPQVGGTRGYVAGMAEDSKMRAIEKAGVTFPPGSGVDDYGKKIMPVDTVFVSVGGDGTAPKVLEVLPTANLNGLPIFYLFALNGQQIGATVDELWPRPLSEMGKGLGVPGIEVKKGEYQRMVMAADFAVRMMAKGYGPFLAVSKELRDGSHSTAHGNALVSELVIKFAHVIQSSGLLPKKIGEQLALDVLGLGSSKYITQMVEKLKNLIKEVGTLPPTIEVAYKNLLEEASDPLAIALQTMIEEGYVSQDEINTWKEEVKKKAGEMVNDVLNEGPLPPERALISPTLPDVPRPCSKEAPKVYMLSKAEAIKTAHQKNMRDPNVLTRIRGVDVNKRREVRIINGKIYIRNDGGYWNQLEDLASLYGPAAVMNRQIFENLMTLLALGESATSTKLMYAHPELCPVIDLDGEYIDYLEHFFEALRADGGFSWTADNKITSRLIMRAMNGAGPGQGTGHADGGTDVALAAPNTINIYQLTRPQSVFGRMNQLLRSIAQPSIVLVDKGQYDLKEEVIIDDNAAVPDVEVLTPGKNHELILITSGPTTRRARQEIEKKKLKERVMHVDLMTIRPAPIDDLATIVGSSNAPVVLVGEEPQTSGWAHYVRGLMLDDERLRVSLGGRVPESIGSFPRMPHFPAPGQSLHLLLPNMERIFHRYLKN